MLRCETGPLELREKACSYYWDICSKDILYWFNVFAWTYDPRKNGMECHLPFITYDFQDEYILSLLEAIRKGEDILVEKSRDMGASWCILGVMTWCWLFDDSFQGLVGSRKAEYVDDASIASLFGKVDYLLNRMPAWMLGDFNPKKDRIQMKLRNPKNGNLIAGETANRDFSRAGRFTCVLLDEFAFWDWGNSVWKATADSTRCRITISTSNGMGNKYHQLVRLIDKGLMAIKKIRLHWKLHPDKTEEWYRQECTRRTPVEVAQELDISYENSVKGRVYENFSYEDNVLANLSYDPTLPLYCSWDFGIADPTAIIWLQKDPETEAVYIIDYFEKANEEISFFVPLVTGEIPDGSPHKYSQEEMNIIRRHEKWEKPVKHFGDPTGGNRTQVTGSSVTRTLREAGIFVITNYKKFKLTARYSDTWKLIQRLYVSDACTEFCDVIISARWNVPEDEEANLSKNIEPNHDWTSHGRTALEYFAVNEPMKRKPKEEENEDEKVNKPKRGAMWTRQKRIGPPRRRW